MTVTMEIRHKRNARNTIEGVLAGWRCREISQSNVRSTNHLIHSNWARSQHDFKSHTQVAAARPSTHFQCPTSRQTSRRIRNMIGVVRNECVTTRQRLFRTVMAHHRRVTYVEKCVNGDHVLLLPYCRDATRPKHA